MDPICGARSLSRQSQVPIAAARTRAAVRAADGPTGIGCRLRSDRLRGSGIALQTLQIRAHLGGVLVAQITIFFQSLVDDLFQLRWHVWIQADGGCRRTVQDGFENCCGAFATEGELPGGHLVQN